MANMFLDALSGDDFRFYKEKPAKSADEWLNLSKPKKKKKSTAKNYSTSNVEQINKPVSNIKAKDETSSLISELSALPDPAQKEIVPNPDLGKEDNAQIGIPDELIIGGIPLIVGALMGDVGYGAGVAGEELVRREHKKEDIRNDSLTGKGRGSMVQYIDNEGVARWGYPDEAHGKRPTGYYSTMKERSEQRLSEAEERARKSAEIKGELGSFYNGMEINKQDIKDVGDAETRFDKYSQKSIDGLNKLRNIKAQLELAGDGNITAYRTAVKEFAKILEGGGRLTDFDVRFPTQRLGYHRELKKILEEEKTGNPDPKIISEMLQVMTEIQDNSSKSLSSMGKKIAESYGTTRKGYESQKTNWLLERLNIQPTPKELGAGKIIVTDGNETYEIDPSDLEAAKKDGFYVMEK